MDNVENKEGIFMKRKITKAERHLFFTFFLCIGFVFTIYNFHMNSSTMIMKYINFVIIFITFILLLLNFLVALKDLNSEALNKDSIPQAKIYKLNYKSYEEYKIKIFERLKELGYSEKKKFDVENFEFDYAYKDNSIILEMYVKSLDKSTFNKLNSLWLAILKKISKNVDNHKELDIKVIVSIDKDTKCLSWPFVASFPNFQDNNILTICVLEIEKKTLICFDISNLEDLEYALKKKNKNRL